MQPEFQSDIMKRLDRVEQQNRRLRWLRGLLLLGCGERTVRFCPPLCITSENVCTALTIFDQVVAQVLAAASGRPTARAAIAS